MLQQTRCKIHGLLTDGYKTGQHYIRCKKCSREHDARYLKKHAETLRKIEKVMEKPAANETPLEPVKRFRKPVYTHLFDDHDYRGSDY